MHPSISSMQAEKKKKNKNKRKKTKQNGKMGSSLPGNFVIWREKIKKYMRETIPHWREICPAGGKFCPACSEIGIFSKPASMT